MRELARRDAEQLAPRPPFAVYGIVTPRLRPIALADAQQSAGRWESIGLAYGDWAAPGGPFIHVTTEIVRGEEPAVAAGRGRASDEADLLRAIDRDRDLAAAYLSAGEDEPEPPDPPGYSQVPVAMGDERVGAVCCQHGSRQAARLRTGQLCLTLVSRGVDLAGVRLAPVTDLRPYLDGRNELIGRHAEQRSQRPPPVLPPAEGVAAVRALVDLVLDDDARRAAALRADREPVQRAGWGPRYHALWQRAVAEQARLCGIGHRAADALVTLIVNQVTQLQDKAAWFAERPGLREAAITETLRYSVLGEDVRSRRAQQAWAAYWSQRAGLSAAEPGTAMAAVARESGARQADWLAEWQAWADGAPR